MKKENYSFEDFLHFFPEIDLPITLTEESSLNFSKHNKPIPGELLSEFLFPLEETIDEYTEIVPCFEIPNTLDFHAIVYWKASLLNYEYRLLTFSKAGEFIDGKVIAGTLTNGETIIRTVATVDEDWIIHCVVGEQDATNNNINTSSKSFSLELLGTGEIIFSLNEKLQ